MSDIREQFKKKTGETAYYGGGIFNKAYTRHLETLISDKYIRRDVVEECLDTKIRKLNCAINHYKKLRDDNYCGKSIDFARMLEEIERQIDLLKSLKQKLEAEHDKDD